jgi:hypothetical protein
VIQMFSPGFVSDIWARRAEELSSDRAFNEEDVYGALAQYSTRQGGLRQLNQYSEAVSAINGVRTPEPRAELLVRPTDAGLDDYIARVDALVGSDEWSVAYYGLHAASTAMWDAAKVVADQLAHSLGHRPGGRVDIDCFVGRYSSTHTGVHVDHAHNFAFTLRDGKTMFTWSPERKELLGLKSPDYDLHKGDSTALANRSDRVAYFPQDFLHVAESKDGVSVNVNIAFWEKGSDSRQNAEYVRTLLRTPAHDRHDVRSSGAASLGPDDDFLLTTMEALLSDGRLKRRMLIAQLISDTSSRLNVGRPPVDVAEIDDNVSLTPISTVQWIPLNGLEEMLVGVNGHVAAFPYSRKIDTFLTRLVARENLDISHLGSDSPSRPDQHLRRVVGALARWGAL